MSKFKKLLEKLHIDEKFTRPVRKETKHNISKQQINLTKEYNYCADVLYLPTAKFGFKYLLVVLDLASDKFDCEPLKNKESEYVLRAMLRIFNRDILPDPKYSLKTDEGSEFKGVFHKWLYDKSIFHKVVAKGNHHGMRQIDALIHQISRIIMTYLVNEEMKKNKRQVDWTAMLPSIRKLLNEYRDKTDMLPKHINEFVYDLPRDDFIVKYDKKKQPIYKQLEPKFKIGDMVHHYLLVPEDFQGNKYKDGKRRTGDLSWSREPKKIEKIIIMNGQGPVYRYILNGFKGKSFTTNELFLA